MIAKYDDQAPDWSRTAYADAAWYLEQRAETIRDLGPTLRPGDTVLDLACGDGGLADFLAPGVVYLGVDASESMVEAARARGRNVVHGDLNDYVPPAPVTATTCFRAIYYARDRERFFARVRDYTQAKLVFDLNPRQYRVADVRADVLRVGFSGFHLQPFFVAQRHALLRPAARALRTLEHVDPIARVLLRFRFTYVCCARV